MAPKGIVLLLFCCCSLQSTALNALEWQRRTIYQVVIDRFALGAGGRDTCDENPDGCLWGAYCGGNLWGVIEQLDYIQGMGFDAIYISPITEQTPCGYHGYWPGDFWKVNSHFGGEEALLAFSAECHKRGIAVLLDTIYNHMGCPFLLPGSPTQLDEITKHYAPFNKPEYFHDTRTISAQGLVTQEVRETGWMGLGDGILTDLAQEHPYVSEQLIQWTKHVIDNYGIDGIRADAVPYVNKSFWQRLKRDVLLDMYITGEVVAEEMRIEYTPAYQRTEDPYIMKDTNCSLPDKSGHSCDWSKKFTLEAITADKVSGDILDGVLAWQIPHDLRKALQTKDGKTYNKSLDMFVESYNFQHSMFYDFSASGFFLDSHDLPRFLNGSADWTTYQNAITTLFLMPGVVGAYYGAEQGMTGIGGDIGTNASRDPLWRKASYNKDHPLYHFTSRLVKARQTAVASLSDERLGERPAFSLFPESKSTMLAWQRGNALVVVSQMSSEFDCACVQTELPPGACMYDALAEDSDTTCVLEQGLLQVAADALPHVFFQKHEGCHACAQTRAMCSATCSSKRSGTPTEEAAVPAHVWYHDVIFMGAFFWMCALLVLLGQKAKRLSKSLSSGQQPLLAGSQA